LPARKPAIGYRDHGDAELAQGRPGREWPRQASWRPHGVAWHLLSL